MIVLVMAISNLVLTRQIYSEEANGAHAHYREPVPLNALDFTVCYDLTKVHFHSADCQNTLMMLLSRIHNGYDSSATAMYFERFCWFRRRVQESCEY